MYRTKAFTSIFYNTTKFLSNRNVMFTRSLYSPDVLGLDGFSYSKQKAAANIVDVDKFKEKMNQFAADDSSKNLIFTEDLKNMIHIAENSSDIDLLQQMITKFCGQIKEVRFGNYVFGPVVMRMFHSLGDADNALKFFNDPAMAGFFDQIATFQILLDLLFEQKKYQEIIDVYKEITSRQVQGGRFPKHVVVLTFGACYRLNTPGAFEFASKLWKDCVDTGHHPMRRGISFFAALAINQNAPDVALEVLSTVKQQSYAHTRILKSLALAKIQRQEDVMPIIKSVLENSNPLAEKQTFPKEMMNELETAFGNCKDENLKADFNRVAGFLNKHGHITNNTIDEILTAEIKVIQNLDRQQNQSQSGGPYNKRLVDQRLRRNELDAPSTGRMRRPGLHELY